MRGHLTKRYKNSWTYVVDLPRDSSGKRRQKTFSIKGTKTEAERKAAEILHQLNMGAFARSDKTLLRDYLEQWLKDYAYPQLAPSTAQGYESIVRSGLIPALGHIPLQKLTRDHIQRYYNEKIKTTKAQTVVHHHTCLHKALETAVDTLNLIMYNPADKVKPPAVEPTEMLCWDEDEYKKFLKAARDIPYYVCFYTELYSGMRRSELLALRWQDIDFETGRVEIKRTVFRQKGGGLYFRNKGKKKKSVRNIVLTQNNIKLLQEYRLVKEAEKLTQQLTFSGDDRIFDFHPDAVTRAWLKIASHAGVKIIRLHDGRHTHASMLFKKDVHLKIVQERLGHASVQITSDIYSHMLPGMEEKAIKDIDV